MVEKLSQQQNVRLNKYLKEHPKASRSAAIQLLFGNKGQHSTSSKGLKIEHNTNGAAKPNTIYLQSGRKVVYTRTKDGKLACKYYGADGTLIKPEYFKKVEGNISISADNNSYTVTKNGKSVKHAAKNPRKAQIDQNIVKLNNQEKSLKKTKKEQGFIGKSWDWFKNTSAGQILNLDGSNKAQKQINEERKLLVQLRDNPNKQIDPKKFEKVTGQKYTKANLTKFQQGEISSAKAKVDSYKEGQTIAVDVASDLVSGVAAFGIYTAAVAAAPFTVGASLAVGVAAAGVVGAGSKIAIKAIDTIGTNRKYNLFSKEAASDALMGSVNGLIAPLTAGAGGAVAKTLAIRGGVQVVKETGKQATKQVLSQATKNAVKQGLGRTFKSQLKESIIHPNNYKLVGGTLSKRLTAYGAEGVVDGGLSGGVYSGVETAKNGGDAGDILKATAIGFGTGALMGGIMTSAAHGKGIVTGNKGAGEVLEDGVANASEKVTTKTSTKEAAKDVVPTPKPQGARKTNTMSNKKLQNNVAVKMGKKDYEYYKKLDKEFFSDKTNLRLTSNFLEGNIESSAFIELRTQLKSLSKNNPELKNLIADLSDEGLNSKYILKYLRELNNSSKKFVNLNPDTMNAILCMQKSGVDSDTLLSFIKLKIENPNIKSIDLLKNYTNRYAQFTNRLNTISSNDIINEFRLLIRDAEFEGHSITRQNLREIISNIKTEVGGLNNDELILAKFDKEMFEDLTKIIDKTPLNESENISEYLIRINNLRKEQNKIKDAAKFNANKNAIEQNYVSVEPQMKEIALTPEELAEFNAKKDYYINKAGDPSTKQGMGVSYEYNKEQKFLALGLQEHERYNSTKYFRDNPSVKPYGKTKEYRYTPVIRFLDLEKSRFNTVQDLVGNFPEKGGSYQANALKCCFTTPVGSNESQIIPDVILEIHPLSEISQGHLVGGWGREVRYGGEQKFKVIDKYCSVEEADFGSGIKREVKGHVILQELPPQNAKLNPNSKPQEVKDIGQPRKPYGKPTIEKIPIEAEDEIMAAPAPKPQGAENKPHINDLNFDNLDCDEIIRKSLNEEPNIPQALNRDELRASLQNGQKVVTQKDSFSESHIHIPTCKNAAPGAKFLETDEAFKQILTDNKYDVLFMHQKYKITGDLDEFVKDMYAHYVKETDIGQFAPELNIKSNTGTDAGAFNNENNSVMISKDYINEESDVAHKVVHELNHWFQGKEMLITTPQGPELLAYNKVLGNLKEMVKNGDITSQADFDKYLREWSVEDAAKLRITYQDLINSTKYPHNNDPASPYFQKANQYFDAQSNYEHTGDNYWNNFTEVESERRGYDAQKAYDKIINEDLALENQAIDLIMVKIHERFGVIDNNTKLQILELAIEDLKNPTFANYSVDDFVNEFIRKLV